MASLLPFLSTRSKRKPEDTPAGCRARAAADTIAAADLAPGGMRQRLEHSAASWIARAELLERTEEKSRLPFVARQC
jgi:hypothetical protein